MKIKKLFCTIYTILCLSSVLLSGCAVKETSQTLIIPQVENAGGYEIASEAMNCMIVTDGEYKYCKFESITQNHMVEFYVGPTEMIIIDKNEEGTTYYSEPLENNKQIYENPLKRIYDDLRQLEFKLLEEESAKEYLVYQATKTEIQSNQQQIDYTKYKLKMTWIDGKEYSFSYYQYVDGAILISAEAPTEIDPYLTPDTKWIVDIDNKVVKNTESNELVDVEILDESTGKALSPNGDSSVTEKQSQVYIYTDLETGELRKIQYANELGQRGFAVRIIKEVDIVKPEITAEMKEMNEETFQMDMMLISVLEHII